MAHFFRMAYVPGWVNESEKLYPKWVKDLEKEWVKDLEKLPFKWVTYHEKSHIYAAHVIHHYTLQQIGDHLGLHYTTISRIVRDEQQVMLQ